MFTPAAILWFLVAAAAAPGTAPADEPRCSLRVFLGGPSDRVTYVHVVATGERRTLPVPETVPGPGEVLPDSAEAFELRVLAAVGGAQPPAGEDLIMVTPWDYDGGCARTPWREPAWIEEGEEAVLTVVGQGETTSATGYHLRVRVRAYPQGGYHSIRGRVYPERGPGPDWLTAGEYFELLAALPAFWPEDAATRREAAERAMEILESSEAARAERYPGTELVRMARVQASRGGG